MDMLSFAFDTTPESKKKKRERNRRAAFPRSFPLNFLVPPIPPNIIASLFTGHPS